MQPTLLRLASFVLFLASAAAAQIDPQLTYFVEVKAEDRTAFHFALEIDRPGVDEVPLSVAAWAPGSYRLMNAADGIKDVLATDETGAAREVKTDGPLTWRVAAKGAAKLRVTWRFTKLTDRRDNRSYMAKTAALLDGPRNYLYWRTRKDLPAHVVFTVPEGWTVASGLDPTHDPRTFVAKNADWLLDCPVLMGKLEIWSFTVRNIPHRIALDAAGRDLKTDGAKVVEMHRRTVEAAADLMGGLPYDHYSFLWSGGGGGGLEHLTSTTCGCDARTFVTAPEGYAGLTAHEHFHAWNVKRLRPAALGPFDYDGPVRTKSLWWAEGITNYYTNIINARSGFVDEAGFIKSYEGLIGRFVRNEASRVVSPEEASWTVWDGVYLAGPISYYDQGEILGLLMDLEIRGRTGNTKSLDDGLRLLYRRYSGARGYQSEDLVAGILDATGVDLHDFFLKHVSGAFEPDWSRYFRRMGVVVTAGRDAAPAISLTGESGGDEGVRIKDLPANSAAERLGLKNGDVVVSINGTAVTSTGRLTRAVRELKAGQTVEILVRRDGKEAKVAGVIEAASELARIRFRGDERALPALSAESALVKAGFLEGDVVLAVDGVATPDAAAARAALAGVKVGTSVKIEVLRNGAKVEASVAAAPYLARTFSLAIDPAATDAERAVRSSMLQAAASRPAKKAG